jgi:hypothetical protein
MMDHRNASPRGLGGYKTTALATAKTIAKAIAKACIRLRVHPNAPSQTGATRLWPIFSLNGNNS